MRDRSVAPRAGARIETHPQPDRTVPCKQSPLAQGRGLKLRGTYKLLDPDGSPLAQGRGLKPLGRRDTNGRERESPLAQGRGLKPVYSGLDVEDLRRVAPRAGARIETTSAGSPAVPCAASPLAQGRGLKPGDVHALYPPWRGRPSRRGAD